MQKITDRYTLFESTDKEVLELQMHIKQHQIPLCLATQLVKSKVKDTAFCKSTRKSEQNTSNLTIIKLLTILIVLSDIEDSE